MMIREIFLTVLCRRGVEAHGLREIQEVSKASDLDRA